MKLHELQPAAGSKNTRTRVGRGLGSGLGKTSGRGQKVKTPVLAVAFAPVLKAAKCLFIVVYQNAVSTTAFLLNNMLKLT